MNTLELLQSIRARLEEVPGSYFGDSIADLAKLLAIVELQQRVLTHYAEQDYYDGGQYTVDGSKAKRALLAVNRLAGVE